MLLEGRAYSPRRPNGSNGALASLIFRGFPLALGRDPIGF